MPELFIIDTSSPFFTRHPRESINWSKTPFDRLEKEGRFDKKNHKNIRVLFKEYIGKVSSMGYNAVALDDMAHMVSRPFYGKLLRDKLKKYSKEFKILIGEAVKSGLKVFVTTDIMFYNEFIRNHMKINKIGLKRILASYLELLFDEYPGIEGVIFRIGEADGVDVEGDFKSSVAVKSPEYANSLIRRLLPVFENRKKLMIFRTWTTGGYPIGDLMWNGKTLDKLTAAIDSPFFILSLKYGTADFFRHLKLNPFFFINGQKKIIELQTRREYEGFGEFPSYTGEDYSLFHEQLKERDDIVGIYVWCQTGGWSAFRNFTFMKKSSIWNEINTFATIKIFRDGLSSEEAAKLYFKEYLNGEKGKRSFGNFYEFLLLSDIAVKDLYYDPEFAKKEYYFNKIRISPLLHILWDQVTLTNLVILAYRSFTRNWEKSIEKGKRGLLSIKRMGALNSALDLPYDNRFHYRTFRLLYLSRKIIYGKDGDKPLVKLKILLKKYRSDYPDGYHFYINFKKTYFPPLLKFLLGLFIRKKAGYRLIDRLLYNSLTTGLLITIYRLIRGNFPLVAGKQGMPVTTFLR